MMVLSLVPATQLCHSLICKSNFRGKVAKMVKGIAKRMKKVFFKPGHPYYPPRNVAQMSGEGACSSSAEEDACSQPENVPCPRVLRPRRNLQEKPPNQGNFIISERQYLSILETLHMDLLKHDEDCNSRQLFITDRQKLGLGQKHAIGCKNCQFVSKRVQTYDECEASKRPAVNVRYAAGLLDTPIGVDGGNILLASMDIEPPSRSAMQRIMDIVSEKTKELNKKDMEEKRQLVVTHNKEHGVKDPNHLSLSFDGRYNANRMFSSYKPGQASSQAYGVAIENHTKHKYVVALAVQNKLCWDGAHLRNKGFKVTCPGGHTGCTANLPYMKPHSERKMAYDIAEELSKEDILVRTLTTDGDTQAYLGMTEFYEQHLDKVWTVTRKADPQHLSITQMKKARRSDWSKSMFPGRTTLKARREACAALSMDIRTRCNAIINKLKERGNGDITSQLHFLPQVCRATVECYAGNCSYCPHDSLICGGTGGVGDWWFHSEFLPTHDIHCLAMTENDKLLMASVLEVRLSEQAVNSVSDNTSTQKCEAFNRGVLSTLPKHVNLSKNFEGTLHSKTLKLNNSLEYSMQKKSSSFTGQPLSPRASKYVAQASERAKHHQKYQKTGTYRRQRKSRRAAMERRYYKSRKEGNYEEEYSKGQLDDPGQHNY